MRRIALLFILLFGLCASVALFLLTWQPFASSDADTVHQITPPRVARLVESPTATLTPAVSVSSAPSTPTRRPVTRTPRPSNTRTRVPGSSPAALTNVTPAPTLTPHPTLTPNGPTPSTEEGILTATAIPAQATLDAMATRSYGNYEMTPGATPTLRAIDHTINVLLMGSDQRVGDPHWNTDVMMLVFLDLDKKQIAVLSLPRDLVVPIPGNDANRLNEADNFGEIEQFPGGGPGMLSFILRDQFNIHVDHYARVGFEGFDKIIDTLGGITVNVPCTIEDELDQQHFVISAGAVHMDGLTAQRYVRSRNTTNDLSRNARQQRVLYAIAQRLLDTNALTQAPALWDQLHSAVETDANLFDMLRLAQAVASFDLKNHPERIHARVLEPPEIYDWITAEGAYVFLPDYELIQNALEHLFDAPEIGTTTATECIIYETPTPTATSQP